VPASGELPPFESDPHATSDSPIDADAAVTRARFHAKLRMPMAIRCLLQKGGAGERRNARDGPRGISFYDGRLPAFRFF
jgi:hypothetical protein